MYWTSPDFTINSNAPWKFCWVGWCNYLCITLKYLLALFNGKSLLLTHSSTGGMLISGKLRTHVFSSALVTKPSRSITIYSGCTRADRCLWNMATTMLFWVLESHSNSITSSEFWYTCKPKNWDSLSRGWSDFNESNFYLMSSIVLWFSTDFTLSDTHTASVVIILASIFFWK